MLIKRACGLMKGTNKWCDAHNAEYMWRSHAPKERVSLRLISCCSLTIKLHHCTNDGRPISGNMTQLKKNSPPPERLIVPRSHGRRPKSPHAVKASCYRWCKSTDLRLTANGILLCKKNFFFKHNPAQLKCFFEYHSFSVTFVLIRVTGELRPRPDVFWIGRQSIAGHTNIYSCSCWQLWTI